MTIEMLTALLPLLTVTLASVAVMLASALRPASRLAFLLTVAGLLLALASLSVSLRHIPLRVTELLILDAYALFFMGLMLLAALVVALFCAAYFRFQTRQEIYVLLLTATLGAMLLVASRHMASFFLGLELLSLSLFPMVAYRTDHPWSLEAGIKYLMLSGVSSALLLFGMALLYCQTGVLSFAALGAAGGLLWSDPLAQVGTLLIFSALAFKLSLPPFHLWTPDVYQGAPAPVTAFVATVSKGALFALLLRFWLESRAFQAGGFLEILAWMGGFAVLVGNLSALLQANLKRMLAYSSIAHMGYLLIAFVSASHLQPSLVAESTGFYLLAYMVTNLAALGVVSGLSDGGRECERLEQYRGLAWRDPASALLLTISLLSLAGIPLTVGFIGKFYVFANGVRAGQWPLVWITVIGSGLGMYYYLRVVFTLIGEPAEVEHAAPPSPPASWTLACLAMIVLALGVFPQPVLNLIGAIAGWMG